MTAKDFNLEGAVRPRPLEALEPEEIRRRQLAFECVLEQSLAGYWDWMIQEGSEYLSPAFKSMFGYADQELPNQPETWRNLIFPEDLPGVLEVFNKHVASRGTFPFYNEVRCRHKDGSTVWVICTGKVIEWGAQGHAVRMVGCHVNITARKQAEAALQKAKEELEKRVAERTAELRASEERFATFMHHLPAAAFIKDEDGRAVYSNEYLQKLLNLQDWDGKTTPELLAGEAGQRMREDDRKALAQGPIRIEETLPAAQSGRRTFETIKFPIHVEGKPTLLGGIAIDITEHKRVEEELRITLIKYKALFDCLPLGITVSDGGGKILESNAAAAKLLGELPETQVQRGIDGPEWRIVRTDGTPMPSEEYASVRALKEKRLVENVEMGIVKSGGTITWINVSAVPLPLDGFGVAIIFKDITERRRVAQAWHRNQAMLARTENIAHVGSWEWDVATDTVTWSDEMFRMFQRNPDAGAPSFAEHAELYDQEGLSRLQAAVEAALSKGTPYEMELRALRTDGTAFFALARGQAEMAPGKKASLLFGSLQDITERKQAEAERGKLEAQNHQLQKTESLNRMAGAIAHHFNNQLGAVMLSLDLARYDLSQSRGINEALAAAMKAARQAAEVSTLMLTYLGQTPSKQEPLELSPACQRCLSLLHALAPKNVRWLADFPSPGPVIDTNLNQIQQLLNNLITNAWEALGEEGGAIRLAIKNVVAAEIPANHLFPVDCQPQAAGYACLEVADEGCGIPAQSIDKLFDPFFSTKFTGRGLGLAVVLGIARAHHGFVSVESQPGRGSVFRIYFPLSANAMAPPPSTAAPALKATGNGTVLLVEDEPSLRAAVARGLKKIGFSVEEAADGVEALELFRQHRGRICCVLSDLTMPRMDGWETITALRELDANLPVILASGYSESQVMAGRHSHLPQAFLSKPYDFNQLQETITWVLGNASGKPGKNLPGG